MINMGYCKFENTLYALRECIDHVEDGQETSEMEINNAKRLYETCKEFIDRCNVHGIKKEDNEGYENFEDYIF